jgi:hypothetical protein
MKKNGFFLKKKKTEKNIEKQTKKERKKNPLLF